MVISNPKLPSLRQEFATDLPRSADSSIKKVCRRYAWCLCWEPSGVRMEGSSRCGYFKNFRSSFFVTIPASKFHLTTLTLPSILGNLEVGFGNMDSQNPDWPNGFIIYSVVENFMFFDWSNVPIHQKSIRECSVVIYRCLYVVIF